MKGLGKIVFKLDMFESELGILEYKLCTTHGMSSEISPVDSNRLPLFANCLASTEPADPFLDWMHDNINLLIHNADAERLEYPSSLAFRPPSIACASSKVVLCAEAVALSDCDEISSGCVSLELSGISQLVRRQRTSKNEPEALPALIEDMIS